MDAGRGNLSKLGENVSEPVVAGALWNALNVDIEALLLLALALFLAHMWLDINALVINYKVASSNCLISRFDTLKLNVTKPSALAFWVSLKLA